jgi:large subunit ribosomal protein L35
LPRARLDHEKGHSMPKQKTNKSALKRFKLTKTGKVKRYKAFKGHMRQTKSAKRKRGIRRSTICAPGDARNMKAMIAPHY